PEGCTNPGKSPTMCPGLGAAQDRTSVSYALEKKVVKSKVGEKVGLPCCHEIPSSESLHSYRVYWQKNTTEVVLAYADGKMISKHEQYVNRTEMDARNLTLWISPVEILDNGSYQCIVQHRRLLQNSVVVCDESVTLFVTGRWIASQYLRCSSYGGFPKPKLSGALDNESTAWNDSWVSESSLRAYNVTGKLWLNVTKDISFTCSVEYNGFLGARQNSAFIYIFNIGLTHTEKKSITVHGLKAQVGTAWGKAAHYSPDVLQ
uniref:Ig-like domain-containing protein n=1 Tax=Buteo japonicus TaxID=224669 RepID=A0A8C0AZE4_9AVES